MMNILNGGKHADNNVDFQEFMVQALGLRHLQRCPPRRGRDLPRPQGCPQEARHEHRHRRRGRLRPILKSAEDALKVIEEATAKAGYKWGEQIFVALDPAMSELWNEAEKLGKKVTASSRATPRKSSHRMTSSESGKSGPASTPSAARSGLAENDWDGWRS